MELNFFNILSSSKSIKMYDISSGTIPGDITSMMLNVTSAKLDSDYDFDLILYLNSLREQDELFNLTNEKLGLSPEEVIPDGVYHFTYTINGHLTKTNKFLVFQTIKTAINTLLIASEYKVNIGDYNITYVDDDIDSKYDIEKVRYLLAVYDKLLLYTQEPNEVEVNNLLDKLNRLLTIINNI